MDAITNFLENQIDWILVLLILISSFWVKKNFDDVLPKISTAHKILIWCTLLTIIYVGFLDVTKVKDAKPWTVYLISYFFATSFYELLWKYLIDWVTKKIGGNNPPL